MEHIGSRTLNNQGPAGRCRPDTGSVWRIFVFALTGFMISELHGADLGPADPTLVPHDYTVDDGPISLKAPLKVFVNGTEYKDWPIGLHIGSGSTLWLALPTRGRFILSLMPPPGYGFQKAGAIRNHVVIFQDGNDEYEVRMSDPIAGAGKAWNVYLLRQPNWQPKGPLFGMDRLEALLRER